MARDKAYRLIHACFCSLDAAASALRGEPSLISERTGTGETPLHYLVVENNLEAVRFLHEAGAELNVQDDFGASPLADSLRLGYLEVTEYLLGHGADPHSVDENGRTALHAAVDGGVPRLVQSVLAAGGGPAVFDSVGDSPLHLAIQKKALDVVRVLLTAGVDVNLRQQLSEETPLHVAARTGNVTLIQLLLRAGADPRLTDDEGRTPAMEAERFGLVAAETCLREAEQADQTMTPPDRPSGPTRDG